MKSLQKRTVRPEFEFCNTSGLLRLFIVLILAECTFSCGPGPIRPGPPNPRVPMRLYQKFPDQHEMSKSASGRSEGGRVRRGSPAFKALVDNYSPDIIFKGDKDQDDRRMTKRCSEKLKILADKVKQRWPKVQLRVIEAYSDGGKGKHEKNSLHYEGRAVDITTSDKDKKKYGMLGRLAYEAGFDWVYYGWKNHIHASVKTDKGAQEGMGCFPGSASVLLENGQRVNMEELRIGDKVQSVDKRGNVVFSPVMLFMDYRPKVSVDFMLIETDKPNRKLAITGTHLIYQLNKQSRRESVVFARDTHAGDFVYISSGTNSKNFTAGRVSRVVHKTITGVYAPLTEQGNIVVDGILCSCYAIVDHDLAHWCFAPVRFVVNIFPNFLKWFENGSEGIHWYARFLRQIYPIWEYVESFQTR